MSARAYLAERRLVPVVTIDDAAHAADLSRALGDAGVSCVEVTLRTSAAWQAIEAMSAVAAQTGVDVGVGTVLTADDAQRAIDAGAHFLVSPGFDAEAVAAASAADVPFLAGCATATEVMTARAAGCDAVKIFPAGVLGGLSYIDALAAPLTDVGFVPSGGVSEGTAQEYLAHPAVPAISGSWMVRRDDIAHGRFSLIAERSRAAMALVAS